MYYFVTVATAVGRQLNNIRAKNRDEAKKKVAEYNVRHPDWKIRLLKRRATNKQSKLETRLYRRR